MQVKPEVPPQVPSVETVPVGVEGVDVVVVGVDEPGQVPKAVWQPLVQWSVVVPHQPAGLQQEPKVVPTQVLGGC